MSTWDNLLSGTIGSVIGLAGTLLVAFRTIQRARSDQASGVLAHEMVALYDELKAIEEGRVNPLGNTTQINEIAARVKRHIIVDAPLLPRKLEQLLRESRKQVAEVVTNNDAPLTPERAGELRRTLRTATESLRVHRRSRRYITLRWRRDTPAA